MAPMKKKYRTIYIVTAAMMVALIGGYALATTSLTTGPTQTSNVTASPTTGLSFVTITSEQLVVLSSSMNGVATAGTQIGTIALYGTPTALTSCAAAPCAAQNFRPVNPATPVLGDYGEQIVLAVTQQLTATGSYGFDFSITVVATTGTSVFQGYLATGTTSASATVTIPVFLFADLGTTTAPQINSLSTVFNQCSTATTCP